MKKRADQSAGVGLLLKRRVAEELLACGDTTLRKLCKAGLLETVQVGGEVRFTLASIKRFIAKGGSTGLPLKGAALRRHAAKKAAIATPKSAKPAKARSAKVKDGDLW